MSLTAVHALFMHPFGSVVELPGLVPDDLIARMEREEFMVKVTFGAKVDGELIAVPLVVNSAVTATDSFEPGVAKVLVAHYSDKLTTLHKVFQWQGIKKLVRPGL